MMVVDTIMDASKLSGHGNDKRVESEISLYEPDSILFLFFTI